MEAEEKNEKQTDEEGDDAFSFLDQALLSSHELNIWSERNPVWKKYKQNRPRLPNTHDLVPLHYLPAYKLNGTVSLPEEREIVHDDEFLRWVYKHRPNSLRKGWIGSENRHIRIALSKHRSYDRGIFLVGDHGVHNLVNAHIKSMIRNEVYDHSDRCLIQIISASDPLLNTKSRLSKMLSRLNNGKEGFLFGNGNIDDPKVIEQLQHYQKPEETPRMQLKMIHICLFSDMDKVPPSKQQGINQLIRKYKGIYYIVTAKEKNKVIESLLSYLDVYELQLLSPLTKLKIILRLLKTERIGYEINALQLVFNAYKSYLSVLIDILQNIFIRYTYISIENVQKYFQLAGSDLLDMFNNLLKIHQKQEDGEIEESKSIDESKFSYISNLDKKKNQVTYIDRVNDALDEINDDQTINLDSATIVDISDELINDISKRIHQNIFNQSDSIPNVYFVLNNNLMYNNKNGISLDINSTLQESTQNQPIRCEICTLPIPCQHTSLTKGSAFKEGEKRRCPRCTLPTPCHFCVYFKLRWKLISLSSVTKSVVTYINLYLSSDEVLSLGSRFSRRRRKKKQKMNKVIDIYNNESIDIIMNSAILLSPFSHDLPNQDEMNQKSIKKYKNKLKRYKEKLKLKRKQTKRAKKILKFYWENMLKDNIDNLIDLNQRNNTKLIRVESVNDDNEEFGELSKQINNLNRIITNIYNWLFDNPHFVLVEHDAIEYRIRWISQHITTLFDYLNIIINEIPMLNKLLNN